MEQFKKHKFNYEWTLKDANFKKDKGTVFSCFSCGGGSTMGYKLAGFDVIGCNEIDSKMSAIYKVNHNPKYCFTEPIQDFKNRNDLPEELYNLDILDGSPPCSSFSMAGNRDKDWGKNKKFNEGQVEQVLDTLFFDFIELGKKLQPKVMVAENVEGLLLGEAKTYLTKILKEFDEAGYYVNYKLLNSAYMGVPQRRKRVFFCCIRKDLYNKDFEDLFQSVPSLNLKFNEEIIPIKNFATYIKKKETQNYIESRFGDIMLNIHRPANTITTMNRYWVDTNNLIDNPTIQRIGSFPLDYNFLNTQPIYVIGMSVPPIMMAQISTRIYEEWLKKE